MHHVHALLVLILSVISAVPACSSSRPPGASVIVVPNGSDVPSFMPRNITGPHAGSSACPLCVYGRIPAVAVWTTPRGLADAAILATAVDALIADFAPRKVVGYVVLLPDADESLVQAEAALRSAFASQKLSSVFLTIADRRGNSEDLARYSISPAPKALTTTIAYANRTGAASFDDLARNPDPKGALRPVIENLFQIEEPYPEIAVRMCPLDEPGEALHLFGRVLDERGSPIEKASVIAYSTDSTGRYVPPGAQTRTPRIRAVAVTNAEGWFRFTTIRPAPYPDTDDPAHIHLHIDAAVCEHTYRTLWFEGDPRITSAKRSGLDKETVIARPVKRSDGAWSVRHDITLRGS